MNISINWLNQYIDLKDLSDKDIMNALTMAGLEAEGWNRIEKVTNVVTAKVISKEKHPNADKLNVCKVSDGENEYTVVCGAPNVAEGQIVPFAKIGAVLGDIKIKEAKLRGTASFGMICSERELGLTNDHSGIMTLPENTPLGADINEILGMGDTVAEFNATPNRPDWLSVIGVARETAAVLKRKLTLPKIDLIESDTPASEYIDVRVDDTKKCPIYIARVIKGVRIAPSPLWMQARLRAAGMRPINNIVDVTNYVLMEWGQPLHAFDIRNIDKGIIVRGAKQGEKITALDGKEYVFDEGMTIIADHSKPLAVAGVMGGEYTSVLSDTDTVVLECAYFDPVSVRSVSKKLKLSSDASYRYERGIDYGAVPDIADYAAALLAQVCGGEVLKGTVGGIFENRESRIVQSSVSRINALLGSNFPNTEILDALNGLGIVSKMANDDIIVSDIPSFREDINIEADIAEEAARIIGYDKIDCSMPKIAKGMEIDNSSVKYARLARNRMETLGFNEAVNFSFLAPEYLNLFDKEENFVKILNPISADMAWMRTSLFPSLIKNMQTNRNHGYSSIKLFELAPVYKSSGKEKHAEERLHLSLGVMGDYNDAAWINMPKPDTFFYLKGILENIFQTFYIRSEYSRAEDLSFLHPGKSAYIYINGKNAGFIGALHPDYMEKLDIKTPCYIAELDFNMMTDEAVLRNDSAKSGLKYKKISRFPSVERDIALVVKSKVNAGDLLKTVRESSPLITEAKIFDVFEGKPINFGFKSVAIRINFTDSEKTLRDDEINPIIEDMLKNLEKLHGAVLR